MQENNTEIILTLQGVCKNFGSVPAIADVSFEVRRGEAIAIVGPSGSGKSTVLRCIDLLLPLSSGSITYSLPSVYTAHASEIVAHVTTPDGLVVSPVAVRRSLGFVFQGLHLWRERTVLSNLTLAAEVVLGESSAAAQARARDLAARFAISDKLGARVWELSGGQQQRAAIVRALMMRPKLLLLDEVTSALDPILTASVMDSIRTLRDESMTMLLVTHHIEFARHTCDRFLFLDGGRVVQMGRPEELLANPSTPTIDRFLKVLNEAR